MELWWHKIIACESIFNGESFLHDREVSSVREGRMSALCDSLRLQNRTAELVEALAVELTTVDRPPESWIAVLGPLLSLQLASSEEASIHYALAGKYNDIDNVSHCAEELAAAESCYTKCHHATGAYKVRYRTALWTTTSAASRVQEIRAVADELLQAEDYHEATNVLQSLIDAMREAGYEYQSIFGVQAERVSIARCGENWLMVLSWATALLRIDNQSVGADFAVGRGVELFEAADQVLREGSMPKFGVGLSMTLSVLHSRRHDYAVAERHARNALRYAEQSGHSLEISEARSNLVFTQVNRLKPLSDNWRRIANCTPIWKAWFEEARAHHHASPQVSLAIHLLDVALLEYEADREQEHLSEAQSWIGEAERGLPFVEEQDARDSMYAALVGAKANAENAADNFQRAVEIAREAIAACGEDKNRCEVRARAYFALGFGSQRMFMKGRNAEHFHEWYRSMKRALVEFEKLGALRDEALCCRALAECLFMRGDTARDVMALEYLEVAEAKLATVRREAAVTRDVDALICRQKLRTSGSYGGLYARAVDACLRIDDDVRLWAWSQRSKARAFLDMLGLEDIILPSASRTGHPEVERLIQREKELVAQIEREEPWSRYALRCQHNALLDRMKSLPELAPSLSQRQGDVIDLDELSAVFEGDPRVVFVDYIFSRGERGSPGEIYMLTVRPHQQGSIQKIKLAITIAELKMWRREFEEFRQPQPIGSLADRGDEFWERLEALVDPLLSQGVTNPEDLLVLCPTSHLYDIPLHAIPSSQTKTVLLERNPVIYCQNFTILRQSALRIQRAKDSEGGVWKPTIFANPVTQHPPPTDEVGKFLERKLSVSPNLGRQATPERFSRQAPGSTMIFYHGHAQSSSENVLDESFLCLSSPKPDANEGSPLTARDIFSLKLRYAPHVALLACQTSQQNVASGDEAMGLIPAFLFGGASSVLGCLWPVENENAIAFASNFCKYMFDPSLTRQAGEGDEGRSLPIVVDLARALRRAALAVRGTDPGGDTFFPYHWVQETPPYDVFRS